MMEVTVSERVGMSTVKVLTVEQVLKSKANEGLSIRKAVARQLPVMFDWYHKMTVGEIEWIGRIARDALEQGSRGYYLAVVNERLVLLPDSVYSSQLYERLDRELRRVFVV